MSTAAAVVVVVVVAVFPHARARLGGVAHCCRCCCCCCCSFSCSFNPARLSPLMLILRVRRRRSRCCCCRQLRVSVCRRCCCSCSLCCCWRSFFCSRMLSTFSSKCKTQIHTRYYINFENCFAHYSSTYNQQILAIFLFSIRPDLIHFFKKDYMTVYGGFGVSGPISDKIL